MGNRKRIVWAGVFLLILLVSALGWILLVRSGSQNANQRVKLVKIEVSAKQFNYTHKTLPPVLQMVSPLLPDFLLSRFRNGAGAGFGFGGDGHTNMYIVTQTGVRIGERRTLPRRLRISDEGGNVYDAAYGASTLGLMNEWVHGWNVRAFPRRSKNLKLEFLGLSDSKNAWEPVAQFTIGNPLFKEYPQWTPENLRTKIQDGLEIALAEFKSGGVFQNREPSGGDLRLRKTRLRFSIHEHGKETHDWAVQKVEVSDATGNNWAPYLDLIHTNALAWASDGEVEFYGALWPGENAWKVSAELARTRGFNSNELQTVELQLPQAHALNSLTNEWQLGKVTLRLHAFGAPEVEYPDSFRWLAKWWGEDKEKVYTLALQLKGADQKHRVILVSSVDDSGDNIKVVQHANSNSDEQVIFLKPTENAKSARLVFAVPRSRFVEFVERPEFIFDPSDP
ncbi:MAG: hypothetical protein ACTHMT_11995 [Verrucomicrobiota bacterium]